MGEAFDKTLLFMRRTIEPPLVRQGKRNQRNDLALTNTENCGDARSIVIKWQKPLPIEFRAATSKMVPVQPAGTLKQTATATNDRWQVSSSTELSF